MFEVGVHESSNEGRQKFLPKDLIGIYQHLQRGHLAGSPYTKGPFCTPLPLDFKLWSRHVPPAVEPKSRVVILEDRHVVVAERQVVLRPATVTSDHPSTHGSV